MDKKVGLIVDRYKNAEEIRKQKDYRRQQSLQEKYRERIEEMKTVEKLAELELEAKLAYRFREGRKVINAQKKRLDDKIQAELLKLKVKQELLKQEKKLIRNSKPKQPKINPLPYLKKANFEVISSEDEGESEEIVEVSIPKHHYQLHILGETPLPRHSQYTKYRHNRHISPDLPRIRM